MGVGRDLENAERNLNLLKQGVNIEEVERIRKIREKSDAESYLSQVCQEIQTST